MRFSFHLVRLAVIAGAALALAVPASAQEARVRRVAVSEADGATVLVVEADRALGRPETFLLPSPDRLVIDLPNARWARGAGQSEGAGVAQRARYANRSGEGRVVLDLSAPAELAGVRRERGGRRLVFTLRSNAPVVDPPPPAPRRLIVIDAGHGGRDPGAVNAAGVREKDVVLAAAQRLERELRARGFDVALTRDDDHFIELEDRVAFARARHADLFISLHADSVPGSQAQGAAVYTLSERGADRTRNMMDRHNWSLDMGDAPRTSDVRSILVSLAQRETTNRSAAFASTVLGELQDARIPLWRQTPRNAGFFVLLAPDVPAVLVEMGFLTHEADAARLGDPRAQARFAQAMSDAVERHFEEPRQLAAAR